LLLEGTAAKEVGKGGIQVPQRFLWGTLRHIVHPGNLGLFQRVELAMQVDSSGTLLGRFIACLLDLQSPVVGPAGGPGVLVAGSHLPISQIQFGFLGPLHPHAGASFHSPTAAVVRGRVSLLGC
jgi:hypothetical protein